MLHVPVTFDVLRLGASVVTPGSRLLTKVRQCRVVVQTVVVGTTLVTTLRTTSTPGLLTVHLGQGYAYKQNLKCLKLNFYH